MLRFKMRLSDVQPAGQLIQTASGLQGRPAIPAMRAKVQGAGPGADWGAARCLSQG